MSSGLNTEDFPPMQSETVTYGNLVFVFTGEDRHLVCERDFDGAKVELFAYDFGEDQPPGFKRWHVGGPCGSGTGDTVGEAFGDMLRESDSNMRAHGAMCEAFGSLNQ